MQPKNTYRNFIGLLPTIGILIFVGLYIYSSLLYPGGSQADLNAVGFDWMNNYWCHLMNEQGMNGQTNPARPIAITAMIILCLSLLLFFIQFSRKFAKSRFWKITIQLFGIISMLFAIFIFTKQHDLMTTLSSIFGVFLVIGIIWEVYKSKMTIFKWRGIVCIFLLVLNNYIYYSEQRIEYLPVIQKITFVVVLVWIIGMNYSLTRKSSMHKRL